MLSDVKLDKECVNVSFEVEVEGWYWARAWKNEVRRVRVLGEVFRSKGECDEWVDMKGWERMKGGDPDVFEVKGIMVKEVSKRVVRFMVGA